MYLTGGPLIQRTDGSLIGITSFGDIEIEGYSPTFTLQAFTKVHAYYDWISEVTGLDTPKCDS